MVLPGYIANSDLLIPSMTDNPFVSQTMAQLKHILAGPWKRKEPIIQFDHVRALIRCYGHTLASLPNLQMVSLIALGFYN